jgi:hypothetical protein
VWWEAFFNVHYTCWGYVHIVVCLQNEIVYRKVYCESIGSAMTSLTCQVTKELKFDSSWGQDIFPFTKMSRLTLGTTYLLCIGCWWHLLLG